MRLHGLPLAGLLLTASLLPAQPPPSSGSPIIPTPGIGPRAGQPADLAPVLDPKNNRLDFLLLKWEERMKTVESVYAADIMRTEKDKSGTIRVLKGEARYLKPNMAALRMIRQDNPSLYELYICTGNFLYEYRPQNKTLRIHDLPQPDVGLFQNNFLSFLFGMNAVDARRRYDLTLTKENENFVYILIQPRFAADKREFTRAEMVLVAKSMLPRRLWFENPNGNEITWDIPNMDTAIKLQTKDFTPPDAPAGWEKIRVRDESQPPAGKPTNIPPRIVRPAGDK